MKILKCLIGLLLTVSCFFVQAGISSTCSTEEIKLKPVFMNGMFNNKEKALEYGKLMTKRLQELYGDDVIGDPESDGSFYLAYNDSEPFFEQLSEVVEDFLIDSIYSPSDKYTEEERNSYLNQYIHDLRVSDADALKHATAISQFLADGYSFVITSHSHGNIYMNALYDNILQNFPERFRVMSVASPVTMDAPKENIAMIVEKSDFIKGLAGIRDYHSSGNSNANNTDHTGHSFANYMKGDDTSKQMAEHYSNFFNDLYKDQNKNCESDVDNVVKVVMTKSNPDVKLYVLERHYDIPGARNTAYYVADDFERISGDYEDGYGDFTSSSTEDVYTLPYSTYNSIADSYGIKAGNTSFAFIVENWSDEDATITMELSYVRGENGVVQKQSRSYTIRPTFGDTIGIYSMKSSLKIKYVNSLDTYFFKPWFY